MFFGGVVSYLINPIFFRMIIFIRLSNEKRGDTNLIPVTNTDMIISMNIIRRLLIKSLARWGHYARDCAGRKQASMPDTTRF